MSQPGFDVRDALESHRALLLSRAERTMELIATVDRTIRDLEGERLMQIRDYYEGFSDEKIEQYRREVRERWGEETLKKSEARVVAMGKERFAALQEEGGAIFQSIADHMTEGVDSPFVQEQVVKWRAWLEHFSSYSADAVLGLGRTYSEDERFADYFVKYGKGYSVFLTKAIEYYCSHQTGG